MWAEALFRRRRPDAAGLGRQDRGPLRKVGEHGAIVTALAVAGATLCSADAAGFVEALGPRDARGRRRARGQASIYALAVVGPVLFAARGDGEAVVAWDVSTKARADAPPYAAESLLAVGKKLYLGRDDGSISVWDAARATPLPAAALEHGHDGCVTALASMAGAVVVSGGEDGAVVCGTRPRGRRWARGPRGAVAAPTRSR